jgi:hypothetical protein
MIHIVLPVEAGDKLEASGGPIPVINQIMERFNPKVVFATVTLREFWMIMNLEDPISMGELSLIFVRKFGSYPELTPILEGDELNKMVAGQ